MGSEQKSSIPFLGWYTCGPALSIYLQKLDGEKLEGCLGNIVLFLPKVMYKPSLIPKPILLSTHSRAPKILFRLLLTYFAWKPKGGL